MQTITISREVAELINRVYLPSNVTRLRTAAPEVVEAVKAFQAALTAQADPWMPAPAALSEAE